ncbi:MBL fold hydrolase [Candidatus Nomurabacteria bacterium CG10_big_fil_rev_8_21_14_0_10_35_16]|uniref:MBL fold hydrolase n=1 Tax=Candidatus Nomurabacteria bacterium CG10_big_fil_rev_8_21_14_0_10_35_16 TaxID=1974731 RepID=A0A2H0TB99_9BACT|nr:MAG: MBL fold hydrolase [Candidatus Nomurabacteria bacterium CG10_big_fil_rev_8_21_14_0_10_35_16]
MDKKVKITFHGGAGTVTGANFLMEIDGKKILVDCGLTQGFKDADDINWDPFPYDPKDVDFLFITHAHIDHIGRIPKLIDEGFNGIIYSTKPTKSLVTPMLEDTAGIVSKNKNYDLKKVYSDINIKTAVNLWQGFEYNEIIEVTPNLKVSFKNAGHILGSAMVCFVYNGKKILFTGDLGNSPSPLLPDTERITDADYVIMESVYGDRNHESRDERRKYLEQVIEDNYKRKGILIIPIFSLERSQELLFELNNLVEEKRIPEMPIFLDSPLAIRLTEIFKQYKQYWNEKVQNIMFTDQHVFDFPGLHLTLEAEESKKINNIPNPKIIIAGSGMSSGGRVVHHEKQYLPDPNNTLLLIGYQSVGSPGRLIQEGVKTVRIAGEYVTVRSHIVTIYGYSGHKDSDGLLNFISDMRDSVKKVFVVMGEPKSSTFLVQKLKDNLAIDAYAPEQGESVTFNC